MHFIIINILIWTYHHYHIHGNLIISLFMNIHNNIIIKLLQKMAIFFCKLLNAIWIHILWFHDFMHDFTYSIKFYHMPWRNKMYYFSHPPEDLSSSWSVDNLEFDLLSGEYLRASSNYNTKYILKINHIVLWHASPFLF